MRRTITLCALLATIPASAQTVSISWSVSNPVLSPDNPTTTVRLTADWGRDDWYFSGTLFDALATNGAGGVVGERSMNGMESFFADEGLVTGDNSILGIEPFCFPPLFGGGCHNPLEVWFDYTATDFTPRTVGYTSEHSFFRVYTDEFGNSLELDWEVEGVSFAVVPAAPALLVPLGAGLLASMSRRRVR